MPLGAISVPTLLYNYWYHISLQPWLFLGHLRGAEVSPKRDITERPVLYFKPNTPTVLNRVKQATLWILLFQVWGERAALRAGPAPICRHTVTLLFYCMSHSLVHKYICQTSSQLLCTTGRLHPNFDRFEIHVLTLLMKPSTSCCVSSGNHILYLQYSCRINIFNCSQSEPSFTCSEIIQ